MKTPFQLIQDELNLLLKALDLSKKHFQEGKIDEKLHKIHVTNLEPKIKEFSNALKKLQAE
jgi:hypothetical protein